VHDLYNYYEVCTLDELKAACRTKDASELCLTQPSFRFQPLNFLEQITDEIKQLCNQVNAIEQLLKKPFKEWTEEEKEEFGNKEQLRDKELELLKQQTLLLQREQNQGIASLITAGTNSAMPFHLLEVKTNSILGKRLV
jgi:hypothetical protein